jgi:hypothetical protein
VTDPGSWADFGRSAAPAAIGLGAALLVLRILRPRWMDGPGNPPPPGAAPPRSLELPGALAVATGAGTGAAVLVMLALGPAPLPGASLLSLLAAQVYLLALAAFLARWRMPLAELVALLLFVPALPLQLLVHAGVLSTPRDLGLFLLPPASFMVDLPAWAVGTWGRGGWNPFTWPRGMAGPGFGTGALVWVLHVSLLLGLAGRGCHRPGLRGPDPGPPHSPK